MKKKDLKVINQLMQDIEGLNNVSIKQKSAVVEVRKNYNLLTDDLKIEVKNYTILTKAEEKIKEMEDIETYKVEYYISLAVDKQILASYELVVKTDEKIENKRSSATFARFLYDDENEQVKKFVKQYDKLVELEEYLKYLEKVVVDKLIAKDIITLIDKIDTDVTLELEDEILKIKETYDGINDDAKEYVTNYEVLENALKRIEEIKNANVVIVMIDNIIFPVDLDDKEYIESCNKYYDELTNNEKSLVSNYNVLVKANEDILELENDIRDKEAALIVVNQINLTYEAINSDVEFEYKNTNFTLAKNLYDSLTDNQKGYVTNSNLLVEMEQEINRLKEIITMKENANKVMEMINNLPKHIELKDVDSILNCKNSYDKLNEIEKDYVTNYCVLEEVLKVYASKENAFEVIKKINNIKLPISLTMKNDIFKINDDFMELDNDERLYVSNYKDLCSAIKEINRLELNRKKALLLIKDINKATVNSIDDRLVIIELRVRYNELDNQSKEIIDNIDKLNEMEKEIKLIEEAMMFESMMDLIPINLTYDYIDEVKDAKAYYDSLASKAKGYVSRYSVLESLLVDAKKLEDKVNKVINLIDKIGDVDITEGDEIATARMEYELLDNSLKQYVYNFEKLLDQERSFLKLQSKSEEEIVVNSYIDEQIILLNKIIAEMDLSKEKKVQCVKQVRESYDVLTEKQKLSVKKYQILVNLEKEIV